MAFWQLGALYLAPSLRGEKAAQVPNLLHSGNFQMSSPRERRQLPSLPPLPALTGSSHCQHACVPTQLAEEKPVSEHCPHSQHVLGGHCALGSCLSNSWENSACCLLRMEVSSGVPGCRFENASSIGILERPWKGGSLSP